MKHCDQVIDLLTQQIGNPDEVKEIRDTAEEVALKWVNPMHHGRKETNGLIYGLVQSGKTGVLTVAGALGADMGYDTILILTSDNDPLYEQTLDRTREAFPGIDILGKHDFKDPDSFNQRIKDGACAIVTTKNAGLLKTLIENFKRARIKGLTCLIIDDEADQASLNTRASKADGKRSAINDRITELRTFFERNTYLQVTATPQALFLQAPEDDFRPKFTVLSHPGFNYVGGEDFFGKESKLVREFDMNDIPILAPGPQPAPRLEIPPSLLRALDTFMVGATYKRKRDPQQNCAFLCHVSTRTDDHKHIVDVLRKYKADLAHGVKSRNAVVVKRLRSAYDDLASTHVAIKSLTFDELLGTIEFFSRGISIKLVNGETDEDVAVKSPYNLFVGGNKLGRGVTIRNLLVSYYGRHPRRPQADTVLQHARMYGYRRDDIGLLRLFLPRELHVVFKAINKMEAGLRELIARRSDEAFRGIYIENGVSATRRNILAPGAVGIYSGGSNYNPAQIRRDAQIRLSVEAIDQALANVSSKSYVEMPVATVRSLVEQTSPDEEYGQRIWNSMAICESLEQFAKLCGHATAYVYVDRDRDLREPRGETRGILTGGEAPRVPDNRVTLFLLRTKPTGDDGASWWPQVRFPDGPYAVAFAV